MEAKITVAKVEGRVRVIVELPDALTALSPRDQERVVENAMWRCSEAVADFVDRERSTGNTRPVSAVFAAA